MDYSLHHGGQYMIAMLVPALVMHINATLYATNSVEKLDRASLFPGKSHVHLLSLCKSKHRPAHLLTNQVIGLGIIIPVIRLA